MDTSTSSTYLSLLLNTAAVAAISSGIFGYPGSWNAISRFITSSTQAVFGDVILQDPAPAQIHDAHISQSPPPPSPPPYSPESSTDFPPRESMLFMEPELPIDNFPNRAPNSLPNNFNHMPLISERGRQLPESPSTLFIEIDDSIVSLDGKVEQFIRLNSHRKDHSLSFSWGSDQHGLLGRLTLHALFDRLNGTEDDLDCPMECFKRMTFISPVDAYRGPFYLLGGRSLTHDCVNFSRARSLEELFWHGDVYLLTTRSLNVPFHRLHTLQITASTISIDNAVCLLQACPTLTSAVLETVDNSAANEAHERSVIRPNANLDAFPNSLRDLKVRSEEDVTSILQAVCWRKVENLTLVVGKRGLQNLTECLCGYGRHQLIKNLDLTVTAHLHPRELSSLQEQFSRNLYYNGLPLSC